MQQGMASPITQSQLKGFLWQPIKDQADQRPTVAWLDSAVDQIIAWRDMGWNVLVHCAAGISRSATVTTGYLMKKYNWDAPQAFKFLQTARPIVDPNPGLRELLTEYGAYLRSEKKDAA